MGEADGSIMPAIMTAHIAHSSSRCGTSHVAVIIQALAPVIGPYMSRAITTIHIQETSGSSTSSTSSGARSYRNADSSIVSGRSSGAVVSAIDRSIPQNIGIASPGPPVALEHVAKEITTSAFFVVVVLKCV